MKLPNAENAVVDIEKLRDYCLNPNHEEGKHKARRFKEKLGIDSSDAERLRGAILDAILKAEARNKHRRSMEEGLQSILSFRGPSRNTS